MKLMVVGSGGREHTIAWKLAQSPVLSELYIAPGNAGTIEQGTNVDIDSGDILALKSFVKQNSIDLTIVGPEQPLVDGIVDAFQNDNLPIFGPRQNAARLEGSKAFAKEFMAAHNIPTAEFKVFDSYPDAMEHLKTHPLPVIVKASGLAAGKGVLICQTRAEAEKALNQVMKDRKFGEAGSEVVIEEFLSGEELSIIAVCDGEHYQLLTPSQDHKAAYDNDQGPNTGGMGAYAPTPIASTELIEHVGKTIINPVLTGMAEDGAPYLGFLYCGLMITEQGPKVLEFNCRLGDPETQVILPLLENDLLEMIQSVMSGMFNEYEVHLSGGYRTCVVGASGGYPKQYEKGKIIRGIDQINKEYSTVFHAGTRKNSAGEYVTSGGRVLSVSCEGETLKQSIDRAYTEIHKINFDGMHFRTDIGKKGLKYNQGEHTG